MLLEASRHNDATGVPVAVLGKLTTADDETPIAFVPPPCKNILPAELIVNELNPLPLALEELFKIIDTCVGEVLLPRYIMYLAAPPEETFRIVKLRSPAVVEFIDNWSPALMAAVAPRKN